MSGVMIVYSMMQKLNQDGLCRLLYGACTHYYYTADKRNF
jgi:hypothetical protein